SIDLFLNRALECRAVIRHRPLTEWLDTAEGEGPRTDDCRLPIGVDRRRRSTASSTVQRASIREGKGSLESTAVPTSGLCLDTHPWETERSVLLEEPHGDTFTHLGFSRLRGKNKVLFGS